VRFGTRILVRFIDRLLILDGDGRAERAPIIRFAQVRMLIRDPAAHADHCAHGSGGGARTHVCACARAHPRVLVPALTCMGERVRAVLASAGGTAPRVARRARTRRAM